MKMDKIIGESTKKSSSNIKNREIFSKSNRIKCNKKDKYNKYSQS